MIFNFKKSIYIKYLKIDSDEHLILELYEKEDFDAFFLLWDSEADENFNKLLIKILNEKYDGRYQEDEDFYRGYPCKMPFYHKDFIEYKPETKQYFIINYTLREDLILEKSLDNEDYVIKDEILNTPIKVNYKLDFKNEQDLKDLLDLNDHQDEVSVINIIQKNKQDVDKFFEKTEEESDGSQVVIRKINELNDFVTYYFKIIEIFKYDNIYSFINKDAKKGILGNIPFDIFFDQGIIIKTALINGIRYDNLKEGLDKYSDEYIDKQFKVYGIYDTIKQYRPALYKQIKKDYFEEDEEKEEDEQK